ncbi:nucleoside diphosphate kinase 2 [Baffinella frigidus]|nr:nucleoside diphosphate kinase 2 [Cryptophyta sp. CCMP2293]
MSRERTFIMIKPDGVQRGLVAKIIERFEQKGFKLVAMKIMNADEALLRNHYEDLSSKPFFPLTDRHLLVRRPSESTPGSIRGDFCIDVGRNICHGSDAVESAQREMNMWFKPEELVEWKDHSEAWVYEK